MGSRDSVKQLRYTLTAICFHWVHALVVFFLLGWGWYMVDLAKGSPERTFAFGLHKTIGIIAFLLWLGRLIWRSTHTPPPLYPGGQELARRLASAIHRLFYLVLVLVPLTGYLSSSFTKYQTKFFGIPLPKAGWEDPAINAAFSQIHQGLTWILVALIVVHVAGAVLSHLKGEPVLRKILPWK